MIFTLICFYSVVFSSNAQIIYTSYFTDEQGIKTLDMVKDKYLEVHKAFSTKTVEDWQILQSCNNFEIFEITCDKEFIGSVYLKRCKYYSKIKSLFKTYMKEEEAVEIYSLYINDKYKGKGYSRKLLNYALNAVKNHYNLNNKFIIGLHLNEEDKYMNVSFSLYYSMNFIKSTFLESGPTDYAPIFHKSRYFIDPLKLVKNPSLCKNKGIYFGMFTRYNEFLPFNTIRNKEILKVGEQLRNILKMRKK